MSQEAPIQVWDPPTTVADDNDLCPLMLILREADSRFIVRELGVILRELYAGSEWRPILFPFARGYLDTVDRIMDPIVAAHSCHKRGISYLPDTSPWELLDAALERWGECPVVSDRTTVEFSSRHIRARRRRPLAGGACQHLWVSRKARLMPRSFLGALSSMNRSEKVHSPQKGVLTWLG